MDPALEELLRLAATSTLDEFSRKVTTPALVFTLPDDDVEFVTHVGMVTDEGIPAFAGDAALPSGTGVARLAVRMVAKTDRNPYLDRISVGRTQQCDIVIRHPSVSKLHAHFLRLDGGWYGLRDAKSKNGVSVNGVRVDSDTPTQLAAGDNLIIGELPAKFVYPAGLYSVLREARQPRRSRPPI